MRILNVSSEAVPFIAKSSLGEIPVSLSKELNQQKADDIDARMILPMHAAISKKYKGEMHYIGNLNVALGWRNQYCGLFEVMDAGLTYYFIDNEYYFLRDEVYHQFDEAEQFAFFCKAVLESLALIDFVPDIIQANDWRAGLIPVYYKHMYQEKYPHIKIVFTIYNLKEQGIYETDIISSVFGLNPSETQDLLYEGKVNLTKAAITCADFVTTVSPTYGEEIKDPQVAFGLHEVIQNSQGKIKGILNGIDVEVFNPQTDRHIFTQYSYDSIEKKKDNKKAIQTMLCLREDQDVPIICMVTRLVEEKGIDLLMACFDELMQENIQFILLGRGDVVYEEYFASKMRIYRGRFASVISFHKDLAHKIYGASNMLLMPSKHETSGIEPAEAMRYGLVPIVRSVGGLKDMVVDISEKDGNGFVFENYHDIDLKNTVKRAVKHYKNEKIWKELICKNMKNDFSSKGAAKEYIAIYKALLNQQT